MALYVKPVARITCDNGNCDKGVCVCDDGYTGSICNTPVTNTNTLIYALVGAGASLLCIIGSGFWIIHKRIRKVHEEVVIGDNMHTAQPSLAIESTIDTDQRSFMVSEHVSRNENSVNINSIKIDSTNESNKLSSINEKNIESYTL